MLLTFATFACDISGASTPCNSTTVDYAQETNGEATPRAALEIFLEDVPEAPQSDWVPGSTPDDGGRTFTSEGWKVFVQRSHGGWLYYSFWSTCE